MRFVFEGKSLAIEFSRERRNLHLPDKKVGNVKLVKKSTYPYTIAKVLELLDGTTKNVSVLYTGVTGCYKSDRFSYEEGRKVALAFALEEKEGQARPSKEFRTAVWNAYRFRPRPKSVEKEKVNDPTVQDV